MMNARQTIQRQDGILEDIVYEEISPYNTAGNVTTEARGMGSQSSVRVVFDVDGLGALASMSVEAQTSPLPGAAAVWRTLGTITATATGTYYASYGPTDNYVRFIVTAPEGSYRVLAAYV